MKLGPRQTAVVMWALIALALAYEAAALGLGEHATISEWVWTMIQAPLFTFAAGMVCGHFVWQRSHCVNCGRSPIRKED